MSEYMLANLISKRQPFIWKSIKINRLCFKISKLYICVPGESQRLQNSTSLFFVFPCAVNTMLQGICQFDIDLKNNTMVPWTVNLFITIGSDRKNELGKLKLTWENRIRTFYNLHRFWTPISLFSYREDACLETCLNFIFAHDYYTHAIIVFFMFV